MTQTKIGHKQVQSIPAHGQPKILEEKPKLTDTASCFIDPQDEDQIAEILQDAVDLVIESEKPLTGDPTEKIIISRNELEVLDAQLMDFVGESKKLNDTLEELQCERDFLFVKLQDAQKEIASLREMVDELVRRLAMKEESPCE